MLALAAVEEIRDTFTEFARKADSILHIHSNEDYENALEFVEQLILEAEDSEDDPLMPLIEMVSRAIEKYESQNESVQEWDRQVDDLNPGASMLRLLMDQHKLVAADLKEEIGGEALISLIKKGERSLTRDHIANLSKRFGISPALFF